MKHLALAIFAVATALLAFGLQHSMGPEDRQREPTANKPVSGDCIPVEQSLLERGSLGLPEPLLVPQMGGLLSYNLEVPDREGG